jgi:hypothetical protein
MARAKAEPPLRAPSPAVEAVVAEIRKKMAEAREIRGRGKTKHVMQTEITALGEGRTLESILNTGTRTEVYRAVMEYVNKPSPEDGDIDRVLETVRASISGGRGGVVVPPIGPYAAGAGAGASPVRDVPPAAAPHAPEPRHPGIREELATEIRAAANSGERSGKTSGIMAHEFASLGYRSFNDLFPEGSYARGEIAGRITRLVNPPAKDPRELEELLNDVTKKVVVSEVRQALEATHAMTGEGKLSYVMFRPLTVLGGKTLFQSLSDDDARDEIVEEVRKYVHLDRHKNQDQEVEARVSILSKASKSVLREMLRRETDGLLSPPIGPDAAARVASRGYGQGR